MEEQLLVLMNKYLGGPLSKQAFTLVHNDPLEGVPPGACHHTVDSFVRANNEPGVTTRRIRGWIFQEVEGCICCVWHSVLEVNNENGNTILVNLTPIAGKFVGVNGRIAFLPHDEQKPFVEGEETDDCYLPLTPEAESKAKELLEKRQQANPRG